MPVKRVRDVRLDFFRGIGMFIIFYAHVPGNPWTRWIPARFGYSDATEIFVFCSGMASAIAFAKVFEQRGMWMGTARILHRVWQVYWAHITLFLVAVGTVVAGDHLLNTDTYFQKRINFTRFLTTDTGDGVVGLLTLTYVPNLFDILPMYLVLLALIPVIMCLERFGAWAPLLFCSLLWLIGTLGFLQLPAEPWSDRRWFFHPLAWQLVFFTGFAFIRGWLPAPPINRNLVGVALAIVVLSALASYRIANLLPLPDGWYKVPLDLRTKTRFGIFRYVHFLALAYLAYAAAGPAGERLKGWFVDVCRVVGQQALAVFMAGIILSLIGGMVFHQLGRGFITVTLVNVMGSLLLIGVAFIARFFKSTPWKAPRHVRAETNRPQRLQDT